MATAKIFLLRDKLETSSRGPGCPYIDMNKTKIAITGLMNAKDRTEKIVSITRAFVPKIDLVM